MAFCIVERKHWEDLSRSVVIRVQLGVQAVLRLRGERQGGARVHIVAGGFDLNIKNRIVFFLSNEVVKAS